MKNRLEFNFVTSVEIVDNLPDDASGQQRLSKSHSHRRDSFAPRIVVCPPVEEMTESIKSPRGGRLLKALSRRLPGRTTDDSTDSSGSSESVSDRDNQNRSNSCSPSSTSESGSDNSERHPRHRSIVSLRRMFQSLNLTSRSRSCSSAERSRQPKKQTQPKRILRPPVTYTYVRGLSGLPTQRVPRQAVRYTTVGFNR